MVALPVLCGGSHTPNELGDEVRELRLLALGKPMKDRRAHELRNEVMEELTAEKGSEKRRSFWCFVTLL